MPEVAIAPHHRHGRFEVTEKEETSRLVTINVVEFREIKPPAWLNGEALEEWNRIIAILGRVNLLTAVDANLLAMYCDTYARWLEIREQINREGYTIACVMNPTTFKVNPLIKVMEALARSLTAYAKHFGFSPLSRQHISIPKDRPKEEPKPSETLSAF